MCAKRNGQRLEKRINGKALAENIENRFILA